MTELSKNCPFSPNETGSEVRVQELLEVICGQRKALEVCLKQRIESASLKELPRLILAQALSCLRAKKLSQVQLLQVLQASGHLTTTAWQLAEFPDLNLLNDIRQKCEAFDIKSLQHFFEIHDVQKTSVKQYIIKAIFYGNWSHISTWGSEEGGYRKLFPTLNHLLKIAVKPDGGKRIEIVLANQEVIKKLGLTGSAIGQLCVNGDLGAKLKALKDNQEVIKKLGLTGYGIGQLCVNGDLGAKLKALEGNQEVIKELGLTGYAIGQLCVNGDLGAKLKALEGNQEVIKELGLTGSAIGQLCVNGDLGAKLKALKDNQEVIKKLGLTGYGIGQLCVNGDLGAKLKALKDNQEVIKELALTGSGIGQLCVNGDLGAKLKALKDNQEVIKKLGLTGYAIGQLCVNGDLGAKLKALKGNQEVIKELGLTGSAIGQLCVTGDLGAKLKALEGNQEVIKELGLTGYKLGMVFSSAQEVIITENLRLLSVLKIALDSNESFDIEANNVIFPQVFTKALAGYVVAQTWTTSNKEFEALINFFEVVDFRELFIQTSGKNTQELKKYVESLTADTKYQYLLLTYLTGNKSVGQKQWAMLKKVIDGAGHGFSPFFGTALGCDGEPIADDRNPDLADNLDLENSVIEHLDFSKVLHSFFEKSQIVLTVDELQNMQLFVSSLDREIDEPFLETLLLVFNNAESLKQFLLGEMEFSEIEALSEGLARD